MKPHLTVLKWRNVVGSSLSILQLQEILASFGGQIRFVYNDTSPTSCSITFTIQNISPTFPPIPSPLPLPVPPSPQPSTCLMFENITTGVIRFALREIIGKKQCPLYGSYYTANGFDVQFGLTTSIWASDSLLFASLFVQVGSIVSFVNQVSNNDFCPQNSTNAYLVVGLGNRCDTVRFEVVYDQCQNRSQLLNNLELYPYASNHTNVNCLYFPKQGQEVILSSGLYVFGPGNTILFLGSQREIILQRFAVVGDILYVRDLANSNPPSQCPQQVVGEYSISCNSSISLSLILDGCQQRVSLMNGIALNNTLSIAAPTPTNATNPNGGYNNDVWVTILSRDGFVCKVAYSGDQVDSQYPASRLSSAQKAYSANSFSLGTMAMSSANLYHSSQPSGPLFGIQTSNPLQPIYLNNANETELLGTENDPMIGKVIGGISVLGGGLALYDCSNQNVVGGMGISGDTSCADHAIAWKLRFVKFVENRIAHDNQTFF